MEEYPELKARLGRFIYSNERMTLKRTLKLFGTSRRLGSSHLVLVPFW